MDVNVLFDLVSKEINKEKMVQNVKGIVILGQLVEKPVLIIFYPNWKKLGYRQKQKDIRPLSVFL